MQHPSFKLRGDVRHDAAAGKTLRSYTMEHTDPLANKINTFIYDELNAAGRHQEADEIAAVPDRTHMGSAQDGSNLPGDMEPRP